jgi:hypothetical protein
MKEGEDELEGAPMSRVHWSPKEHGGGGFG